MLRIAVGYAVLSVFTLGFLTGFNEFVEEDARMGVLDRTGRALAWPFTLGQVGVGWLMGDVDLPSEAASPEAPKPPVKYVPKLRNDQRSEPRQPDRPGEEEEEPRPASLFRIAGDPGAPLQRTS